MAFALAFQALLSDLGFAGAGKRRCGARLTNYEAGVRWTEWTLLANRHPPLKKLLTDEERMYKSVEKLPSEQFHLTIVESKSSQIT